MVRVASPCNRAGSGAVGSFAERAKLELPRALFINQCHVMRPSPPQAIKHRVPVGGNGKSLGSHVGRRRRRVRDLPPEVEGAVFRDRAMFGFRQVHARIRGR